MHNNQDFDDLVNDFAKGSRPRPKLRGRKKENVFVCKKSIDFTAEMWEIIQNHIKKSYGNPRTVIYEGLELLAKEHD